MLGKKESRAIRPDAQAFDEIRIQTVPRYKTSELSGDEWRISASVKFLRKGQVRYETGFYNIETACGFLYAQFHKAAEAGHAYFAGEGEFCDQEGCQKASTVKKFLKKKYCNQGHSSDPLGKEFRLFCDEHKTRGDCGLDDSDDNYTDQ